MTYARSKWHALDRIGFWFILLCMVIPSMMFGAWAFWNGRFPPERWYVLHAVSVMVEGREIRVAPVREIHQDFLGSYTTSVRPVPGGLPVCSGGQSVPYRAGVEFPGPVSLGYWTGGAQPPCEEGLARIWDAEQVLARIEVREPVPAQYLLTTCITIRPNIVLLGDRQVPCVESNIWTWPNGAGECPHVRVSRNGRFHEPGSPWYNQTRDVVRCFETVEEAEAAGYRRAGE